MSATTALALGTSVTAAALVVAQICTWRRHARLAARVRHLERVVDDQLVPAVTAAASHARRAETTARAAAIAAGVSDPPPRLPLEPVTGPVVRAVAFGAGARRALARVAAPPWSRRAPRVHRRSA